MASRSVGPVKKIRVFVSALLAWPTLMLAAAQADTLSVPGTGDGIEVLQALASEYAKTQTAAMIEVPPSVGSGGGIAAVADGRAVLGRVARPLTASEAGAGLSAVALMRIPAVIFTHPSAGVKGLSYEQLTAVFAGSVTNWRDVGGPDLRIRVVRRESEDSTLKVLRATMPGWQSLTLTTRSKTAVTTQEAVESVRETEGAIGFGPNSSALVRGLTVLALDGKAPSAPDYPSAVNISLIFKKGLLTPEAESFVNFATSAPARMLISGLGALPWND